MSGSLYKYRALLMKNVVTMRRNVLSTIIEFFFTVVLLAIAYFIMLAFSSDHHKWPEENGLENYLIDKGNMGIDPALYTKLPQLEKIKPYVPMIQELQSDPILAPQIPTLFQHAECFGDLSQLSPQNQQLCQITMNNLMQNPTFAKYQTQIVELFKTIPPAEIPTLLSIMTKVNYLGFTQGIWNYTDPLEEVHPIESNLLIGLPLKPLTMICYDRFHIGLVNIKKDSELGQNIINYIAIENASLNRSYVFVEFTSVQELNEYIKADDYGMPEKPTICFAVNFEEKSDKSYNASLHYFDNYVMSGVQDVPYDMQDSNEIMQQGPNMEDVMRYSNNGYIQILNILANYALKKGTGNPNASINYGFGIYRYDEYRFNQFSDFAGLYYTFFVCLGYLGPLILYVLKMTVEKESRTKEVMKIMGMSEMVYFGAYFTIFFIVNLWYAFVGGIFLHLLITRIAYLWEVLFLWLFGLNIFSLAYFFNSIIDKTRLALIISTLVFCLMLFVSAAVWGYHTKKTWKIVAALLPPVNCFLGCMTMGYFQGFFCDMKSEHIKHNWRNYSLKTTYLMFTLDFFIYLILAFYLLHVLPHEFGIQSPWYFVFQPSYWKRVLGIGREKNEGQKGKKNVSSSVSASNQSIFDDNPHKEDPENFQDEDLYKERDAKKDVFKLRKVKKIYDDGKCAVNEVSFNLFRNEIFALLGRNGAGKTSLINVLIGMYEATSGEAIYKEKNILDILKMEDFRNKLGICPQHDILFPDLTIREHLTMFCYFKGFPTEEIDEEVTRTLKDFRIHDIADIVAGTLSAGQRRKLSIAIAVVGGSEVIFLDEPSSGMDITSRRNLWEILKRIIEGKIIILTTHYMEEAAVLGNRIGIMAEGVLKCLGTPLFLIERYGKYMSITVNKNDEAENERIIKFFQDRAEGIDYEILSQEILIRIPKFKPNTKEKNINIGEFFRELDENTEDLEIKNYSAAMPTLEDVFLNVGSVRMEEEEMLEEGAVNEEENDRIMFKEKYIKDYTYSQKLFSEMGILYKKRLFQVYRDPKTFVLEIICPILLTIVGCVVVQVELFKDTIPLNINNDFLTEFGDQVIYYGTPSNQEALVDPFKISIENVTSEFLPGNSTHVDLTNSADRLTGLKYFIDDIYQKQQSSDKESYGSLYVASADHAQQDYSVVELINGKARQGPMLYAWTFLNKILGANGIEFTYTHYPLPTTQDIKANSKSLNNFCLVFFVNTAFALIPANFIGTIVKERINNSKHLMRISGVSLVAYWFVNYSFELIKYYITAGICLLILWAFDFIPRYFIILYLLYGPAMISCTYLISFAFTNEAYAQNFLILFNLVLGCLASTVVIMFRSMEDTTKGAKTGAFFIRIVPAFSFGYGYNLLLNGILIMFLDYSIEYKTKPESTKISMAYAGADCVFLAATAVIYMVLVAVIETRTYKFDQVPDNRLPNDSQVEDKNVLAEIDRANKNETIFQRKRSRPRTLIVNDSGGSNGHNNAGGGVGEKNKGNNNCESVVKFGAESENQMGAFENMATSNYKNINPKAYAVKLKNIKKVYDGGCCGGKETVGVKNISFCVEYGECFGMLGLNGAGKTTIFKAITQEHSATHGSIFINGQNLSTDFDEIKNMFGYCPQFDAIFEYMSVYENLEFYSRIKGVDPEKLPKVVKAMIEAMTLSKYRDKLAGRLSGGNKRKLSVAISMICNPPIVLLDEPSTGMDPEARRFMWAIIHKLTSKNDTNSVIMTTHAMDEAETLCKRMGIMVNGEFVCLGTANYIKETYGYGYEIDVRIKPINHEKMKEILQKLNLKKNHKVKTFDEANDIINKLDKSPFSKYLTADKIGIQIYKDIEISGYTHVSDIINWIHYVYNVMKMIKVVMPHYTEIILTELIENNFLFKVKKTEDSKSIGSLFTILEEAKEDCEITEYSIQQTSLEQIFNKFAEGQGKTAEELQKQEKKFEIIITDELINDLTQ